MGVLGIVDWLALAIWAALWMGFSVFVRRQSDAGRDLNSIMAHYRHAWMQQAWTRDNRITDIALMGNLMHSATFFSSTTLLVVGALFAFLGTVERGPDVIEAVSKLPFAERTTQQLLEVQAFSLTLIFVYALLRFTWSLRQFNLCCILVGAFPPAALPGRQDLSHQGSDDHPAAARVEHKPGLVPMAAQAQIAQAGRLTELAGINFSQGLRAYYFAVPLLVWLISPWLMMAAAVLITLATYYMEFRSATVRAIGPSGPAE